MATVEQLVRSSLACRVTGALEDLLRRGEFQSLQLGRKMRVGRVTHRMLWHHNRTYRFVLDIEADAVMFPGMLPATLPPQLVRELQTFLRHEDCIDPQRGESRMFVQHGALTLSVTVKDDAYEYCTEYLVRLADRVLGSILEQPVYDRYRANSLIINSNAAEYA